MPATRVELYSFDPALAKIGVGLMSNAYQSLTSKAVPRKERGTAFGLFNGSLGLTPPPFCDHDCGLVPFYVLA